MVQTAPPQTATGNRLVPPSGSGPQGSQPQSTPSQITVELLMAILSEIDLVASRLSVASLSMLPAEHELHQYIRKLLALLVAEQQQQQQAGSAQPESATLLVAKQVFLPLFAAIELPLRFELHLYLLEGVQTVCTRLRKELTSWLLYLDDEVRERERERERERDSTLFTHLLANT